jgi:hypothetical protein
MQSLTACAANRGAHHLPVAAARVLADQLRGRGGARQVQEARIGLAESAGGSLGDGPAGCVATILAAVGERRSRPPWGAPGRIDRGPARPIGRRRLG